MGDFNAELSNDLLYGFCEPCNLKSLIEKPTCFKNPDSPKSIDLILTNRQKSYQNFLNSTGLHLPY